jgi:hypothetical protein
VGTCHSHEKQVEIIKIAYPMSRINLKVKEIARKMCIPTGRIIINFTLNGKDENKDESSNSSSKIHDFLYFLYVTLVFDSYFCIFISRNSRRFF